MNNYIKTLIIIGSIVLFSEVFRLVNSARIDLNNKNVCVKKFKKYYESEWADDETMQEAYAYKECQ
mgnify:CR=1 FL=1|tara:strand:+ start:50 stop:247 length:198 start_codon:yes stop_codon:yes gene_type:complete